MADRVASPPSETVGVAAQAYGAVALGDGRVRLAWRKADALNGGEAAWQSAAISEAAEREAAAIIRQACAQTEGISEDAAREAPGLRAAIAEMSAKVGGVVYVTEDLFSPAGPSAQPATRQATKLLARPGTGTGGRQVRAMRKAAIAFVALFLVGVISGAVEIEIHGFSFFLFRNAGAGAGNSHDLNENQGPGQSGAPGADHTVSPG